MVFWYNKKSPTRQGGHIYEFIIKNEIEVKSITVDNGLEFNSLGLTTKKLEVKLYKCDLYCSFQRGLMKEWMVW